MRLAVLALALLPAVAVAQVDLTPGPDAPPGALDKLAEAIEASPDAHPAAGWCVADAYRAVADRAENPRVAAQAIRTARKIEREVGDRLAASRTFSFRFAGDDLVLPVRAGVVCRAATGQMRRWAR